MFSQLTLFKLYCYGVYRLLCHFMIILILPSFSFVLAVLKRDFGLFSVDPIAGVNVINKFYRSIAMLR